MREHLGISILLIAAAFFMAVFPARIHECDAVIYATCAIHKDIGILTDPGHLAFGLLAYIAALIGQKASPPLNPIYLLQFLSTAVGLAGVYLFWRVLRRITANADRALLFSAVLVFSYGYWHFSLQGESHILAVLFLVSFLWYFFDFVYRPSHRSGVLSGLMLGVATLMHQTSILLLPLVYLSLLPWKTKRRRLLMCLGSFSLAYCLVAVVPYLLVGWWIGDMRTVSEFRTWVLGVSVWGRWGGWRLASFPSALVGIARTFVGSHSLLGFQWVGSWARSLFPGASWEDEMAIAGSIGPGVRYVLLIVESFVFLVAIVTVVRGARKLRAMFSSCRPLASFVCIWVVVFGIFFTWWSPERTEYWVPIFLPVLIVLAFRTETAGEKKRLIAGGGFLVALFLANFLGSIYPQSLASIEPDTRVALGIDAVVRKGDIVISDCSFGGRATKFIRSFEKIDLVKAASVEAGFPGGTLRLPRESGMAEGTEIMPEPADSILTSLVAGRAIDLVDSLLAAAEKDRRALFLVLTPLSPDSHRAYVYRELTRMIVRRSIVSEGVPVRGGICMIRLSRQGLETHR
jgi:hypothetical protein